LSKDLLHTAYPFVLLEFCTICKGAALSPPPPIYVCQSPYTRWSLFLLPLNLDWPCDVLVVLPIFEVGLALALRRTGSFYFFPIRSLLPCKKSNYSMHNMVRGNHGSHVEAVWRERERRCSFPAGTLTIPTDTQMFKHSRHHVQQKNHAARPVPDRKIVENSKLLF
jgi:hypothetical protein